MKQCVMSKFSKLLRPMWLLLFGVAMTLTSCRGTADRLREQIRFDGIAAVRVDALPRVEIDFEIINRSAHHLFVDEAEAVLCYRNAKVASLELAQGVKISRRTEGVVTTDWQVEVRNPLAMIPLLARVTKGDLDQLTVDLRIEGRGGVLPVNILRKKMPLSDFLNTFDVESDLLKHIAKP